MKDLAGQTDMCSYYALHAKNASGSYPESFQSSINHIYVEIFECEVCTQFLFLHALSQVQAASRRLMTSTETVKLQYRERFVLQHAGTLDYDYGNVVLHYTQNLVYHLP
jgi:hypothetical protein